MASFDDLDDRQRALLQLLLKQGKSYDEIAALLKSDGSAVQARAHTAVSALGPEAPDIGADRRGELADYLLGQQSASRRAATREYLEDSADGRAWARAVGAALRPLAGDDLPEIPEEPAEVDEAFRALRGRMARQEEVQRSDQLGTKILFGAAGLIVAIVLIVALGVFDGDDPKPRTSTVTRTAATATTPRETPQIILHAVLRPPDGSDSDAGGETAIVRYASSNQFRLLLAGEKLPVAPEGSAYAVWLYSSAEDLLFVGFPKATVSDDGKLEVVADLTPQTRSYREVLVTRERVEKPSKPGRIVLRGALAIPQQTQTQTTPGATQTAPTETQTTP
jgi:hypothetical protein